MLEGHFREKVCSPSDVLWLFFLFLPQIWEWCWMLVVHACSLSMVSCLWFCHSQTTMRTSQYGHSVLWALYHIGYVLASEILIFFTFLLAHLAASLLTLPGGYSKLCYPKGCNYFCLYRMIWMSGKKKSSPSFSILFLLGILSLYPPTTVNDSF